MNLFNRLLRNLINLILCLAGAAFCVGLTIAMVIANYLASEVSFELLGYDKLPLNADKLLGPFFGAFFAKATLTHLYAMVVAIIVTVGLFLSFRLISHIFELYKERQHYLNAGDTQSARIIVQLIVWDLIELLAFAVPLTAAICWDVQLFRFRSICGAAGVEDPEVATALNNWELQLQENGTLWAWAMTSIGAWGYISITALACLAFEYTLRKTSENWSKLLSTIEEMFSPADQQEGQPAFYGYDQDGQPVYDPYVPVSYDVNGNLVQGANNGADISPETGSDAGGTRHWDYDAAVPSASSANPGDSVDSPTACQGFGGKVPGTSVPPDAEEGTPHDVIGSPEGERVTLAHALQHPERYWVDPETHEIWDADYRRELFGEGMRQAA